MKASKLPNDETQRSKSEPESLEGRFKKDAVFSGQ